MKNIIKDFSNYNSQLKFTSSQSYTFHRWIYVKNAFYESQRWWDCLWASVSIKAERSQSLTDLEKCQDGDFEICVELGDAGKDRKKAVQLYEKAFDGEEMFGYCSLVFASFLTDLNPNEQIPHNSW